MSSGAHAWKKTANFEGGTLGLKTLGTNAFSTASSALFSNKYAYEGSMSSANTINQGEYGYGVFGGVLEFPAKVNRGGEIWLRVRAYFPSGFSFTANPWLKFLRIHTQSSTGSNIGYDDWYINTATSTNPFRFIYEGEQVWHHFGTQADFPQYDRWETYEMYVKLDTVPASKGGQAVVRMWKNGKLIGETKDRITLANTTAQANAAYIFTYWNGAAPKTQTMYLDDIVVQTDIPAARDAAGNPYIGMGGVTSTPVQSPPNAPVLKIQ